jgi:RHS repeat-associated protein
MRAQELRVGHASILGGLLLGILLIGLWLSPAARAAECTNSWTGPAEGSWGTVANWSAGHVPNESDVACIGSGKTVKLVAGGTRTVLGLQGEGALTVRESTIKVLGAGETWQLGNLKLEYQAVLAGEGTLEVTKGLTWNQLSTMSGPGETILGASAASTIGSANSNFTLAGRKLVNKGTITQLAYSQLAATEGGVFENLGTFNANGEKSSTQISSSGVGSGFVNKGTFQKTEGTGTYEISADFENLGTFVASTGQIKFEGTGHVASFADESKVEGVVTGEKTNVTLNTFSAPKAAFWFRESTVTVPAEESVSLGNLTLSYLGNITGAGMLEITKGLAWESASTMSGTGTTLLASGAVSTIGSANSAFTVAGRKLINEGTITQLTYSRLNETEGGVFENIGTYNANGEGSLWQITSSGVGSKFVNKGTLRKTEGTGRLKINSDFENLGLVQISTGSAWCEGAHSLVLADGSDIEGTFACEGPSVTFNTFSSPKADLSFREESITIPAGEKPSIGTLRLRYKANLSGAGDLEVTKAFLWEQENTMSGSGTTTLLPGTVNVLSAGATAGTLTQRTLVNEGTFTHTSSSRLNLNGGARFKNEGTYNFNPEPYPAWVPELIRNAGGGPGRFVNNGLFQRTEGTSNLVVTAEFENHGVIKEQSSKVKIEKPVTVPKENKFGKRCQAADPVECATGDFIESQTDVSIGGRGIGLNLTRGYSAQAAAAALTPGPFGYGWTSTFRERLAIAGEGETVTFVRGNGSTVPFSHVGGSVYSGPGWAQETLAGSPETGFTLTRPDQVEMHFSGSGELEAIVDRNGNETTLAYDEEGRLETVTDPGGRELLFAYNEAGFVKSVEDPMGHVVSYAYEGGNLASVTLPGAVSPRWQYKYDGSHRITSVTDGRGGKTTNEYDGSGRVISQTDPTGRTQTFKYEAFHTTITNKSTGAVTDEWFTSNNQPYSVTRGFGTPYATTETFGYDGAGRLVRVTDGNGHTTTYGYDAEGNRTSEKSPAGETKWTYNGTHDVMSVTNPAGVTTTFARDGDGNLESASTPGPLATTQTTTFAYDEDGQLESITDPLERTWSFGYDSFGNRTSEVDPLGYERTWTFDEDSRLTATVSPRGNLEGAEPSEFESTVERDPQGRILKATNPLGQSTEYTYDGNGNVLTATDAKGNTTKYTYNGFDQRIKVEKPSGAVLETGYDGAGFVTSQTDGNEETTTYVRNVLGQPVEVIDPLGRKTTAEFDAVGNPVATVDAAERETTFTYDTADRLTKIGYSAEGTPDVEFEYDAGGSVTTMVDGAGESSYDYDVLGRLTRTENGHGDVVEYQYDIADQLTGLVYPNGKAVSRAYDPAGRLESVTDWLGGTTSFLYDADSNLEQIDFPAASGNVDEYTYDRASRMTSATFTKESETLASLAYGRDPLGQVEEEIREGLPGAGVVGFGYDKDNRLIEAGAATFEYDAADNLTKGLGSTNAYDAASQLETGTGVSYAYDQLGQRVETDPSSGPATSYGYDQAGNLTSIERPEEGESPALAESFAYDGNGLLASKVSGLTTRHLTWDTSTTMPLLLSDEESSFIYGPGGRPIQQISTEESPTYIHHDHLGSSRLLTGASGEVSAALSYGPYGGLEGKSGSGSTPLGFAGQYTDEASGLQYLRARFYDPATGQFMSRDPIGSLTRAPYSYVGDNPVNMVDPSGLCGIDPGDWLENINPISEENCAYQAAEKLREETGIDLPGLLSSPPVVSTVAGGICVFSSGLACGVALVYAFGTSSADVLAEGFETDFCDVPNLIAQEAVNGILLWFSSFNSLAGTLAKNAPPGAKAIIKGGPAVSQGGLDAAQSKHGR